MTNVKYYIDIVVCSVLFTVLLVCYNGLWNLALYPMSDDASINIAYCFMISPASGIAFSLGGLSLFEVFCTVPDSKWKSIAELVLWSLLTILLNFYTAYLISPELIGVWVFLIGVTIINIYWYVKLLSVLNKSKKVRKIWKALGFEKNETPDKQGVEDVNVTTSNLSKTRELAYRTLRQIGCKPEDTEEGRIKFDYQGVTFLMEAVNGCLFVNLIWPWCHSFSKFDIDEFARVRQVVNEVNMQGTMSVFYTVADSDDVALHIKKHFLLVPQILQIEEYLKTILDVFFRTARTLDLEIEKGQIAKV